MATDQKARAAGFTMGLADPAWGVLAVVAVVGDWGLALYSACFLVVIGSLGMNALP